MSSCPSTGVHLYAGMSFYMQFYIDTFKLCNRLRAFLIPRRLLDSEVGGTTPL